jgi:RNase adapter protein RapZ
MTEHATAAPPAAPREAGNTGAAVGRRLRVLLVTGLSGAGHSTALNLLEDLGYEAVDNLPLALLGGLTGGIVDGPARPIAIGVDAGPRDFSPEDLIERLDRLRGEPNLEVKLIFLDCDDEVLRRRYTETRRRHPLALDRPVADGIAQERALLAPLRAAADLTIDTSELAIGDLKHLLQGHFALDRAGAAIAVLSFSYRQGLPREADLVFDARFLRNPHYEKALRPLSGRDRAVGDYLEDDPGFPGFFGALTGLLAPLLPRFEREGKSYLTLAIGCTGGRHRSVYVAEKLAAWLRQQGYMVGLRHRDLGQDAFAE